jgi:hypothetical protein
MPRPRPHRALWAAAAVTAILSWGAPPRRYKRAKDEPERLLAASQKVMLEHTPSGADDDAPAAPTPPDPASLAPPPLAGGADSSGERERAGYNSTEFRDSAVAAVTEPLEELG